MSNAELPPSTVTLFNKGERQAFKELFDYYYNQIFYFAHKIMNNKEDAEDIVMDVFTRLFDRHDQFATLTNIKAFLFISTRNLCLNGLRDKRYLHARQKEFLQKMENDYKAALEFNTKPDILNAIQNEVNNLPDTCRKIFKMLFYEDLNPAEVAEKLNISVANVYSQKKRALQMLRLVFNHSLIIMLTLNIFKIF